MLIKTYKYFNQITRQALFDQVEGYVNKSKSISKEIVILSEKYKLNRIYRFDLGENVDGYSPKVKEFLENACSFNHLCNSLSEYPDITHRLLRQEIADFYGINRENIVVGAGLDAIIDIVSRVFFDNNDMYMTAVPEFFLFESYSEKIGARPVFLVLDEENNFEWDNTALNNFTDLVTRFKPKLVWLSNPGNPTGKEVGDEMLKELIKITNRNNVFLVVDEAYGEYGPNMQSAVRYINRYRNLMVLRTFSKAYGLAGLRIGYLMSASRDINKALLLHRQYFPASQLALEMASIALRDQGYIEQTRENCEVRKQRLFSQLGQLETFKCIPSASSIFMLKSIHMPDDKLNTLLKKYGIIASVIKSPEGQNHGYLRFTVRKEDENDYLVKVCREIETETLQTSRKQDFDYTMG